MSECLLESKISDSLPGINTVSFVVLNILKGIFRHIFLQIPTMIGEHIALFGMVVGVGELVGSLALGKILCI